MQCASKAVLKTTSNPRFLGAQTGCLSVLHTWGQTLSYHPHVHMLCPAGGLSFDGREWIESSKNFLVPVKALRGIFRALVMKEIKLGVEKGTINLRFSKSEFYKLKETLYAKNWHVYLKKGFRGLKAVLNYLGRYTHRVAFNNSRIVSIEDEKTTFRYKDYRDRNRDKLMTLSSLEFARQFLQHNLPKGFYKIRYTGLFGTVHQKVRIKEALAAIALPKHYSQFEGLDTFEVLKLITEHNPTKCPKCKEGRVRPKPLPVQLE